MMSLQCPVKTRSATMKMSQKGVTLVEVLVSVLVLSIGLLGVAGLQAGVAKYKINSMSRASIATLYSDLADRVRMNSDVAGNNVITGILSTSEYSLAETWANQQTATLALPSPNCDTATCTPSQRATFDLLQWRQNVRANLPQGAALVSGNRGSGVAVTLMWFDKEFRDGTTRDLISAPTCSGTELNLAAQQCCPTAASAAPGVRCTRFTFIP